MYVKLNQHFSIHTSYFFFLEKNIKINVILFIK